MSILGRCIAEHTKVEVEEELLVDAQHQPSLLSIDQTKDKFQQFELILESTCMANKNGGGKACEI
jgi:hypothetical protein